MGGNLGSRYVLCNIPATQIEAVAPFASMLNYGATLRKLGGSDAGHTMRFSRYGAMSRPPASSR